MLAIIERLGLAIDRTAEAILLMCLAFVIAVGFEGPAAVLLLLSAAAWIVARITRWILTGT